MPDNVPPPTEKTTPADAMMVIEQVHGELVKRKLELEIGRLRQPFFMTTAFWVGLITVGLTIPGIYWQHVNSQNQVQQKETELAELQNQLLETTQSRTIAIQETQTAKMAFESMTRQMRWAAISGGEVRVDEGVIPRIVGISFHHQSFDDRSLQNAIEPLSKLAEFDLCHLSLRGTAITNQALKLIADNPVLRTRIVSLDLRETRIGDDGIKQVVRFKNLTTLSLQPGGKVGMAEVLIHESSIGLLHQLTQLRKLAIINQLYFPDIGKPQPSDEPLWSSGKTGITMLNRKSSIPRYEVTDSAISQFDRLAFMESLTLEKAQITDASLPILAGMTNLSELNLKETQVSVVGTAILQNRLKLVKIIPPGKTSSLSESSEIGKTPRASRFESSPTTNRLR